MRLKINFDQAMVKYKKTQTKEEGKDQETIYQSTTSDPRHHMEESNKHKKTSHKRSALFQQVIARLQGIDKTDNKDKRKA